MYATAKARESRREVLLEAIRELQLGALVAATPAGLIASHLPIVASSGDNLWLLECHCARANPLWEQIGDGCPAVAIFQGPHAYVHPGWFVSESAQEAAVPTWTYIAVHVHGQLKPVHDQAWLLRHLSMLAANNEGNRDEPWSPSQLPPEPKSALLKNIVGLELLIDRMEGSWKMAQGLPQVDRRAVADALQRSTIPRETEVATIMSYLLDGE